MFSFVSPGHGSEGQCPFHRGTMNEDQSTITVTKNGEPVSVLMTAERYDALMETIEILSDKKILDELAKSSDDFKSGRVYKDKEVWKD